MTKLEDLPTRELRRLQRKRGSATVFTDQHAIIELELIRRAERANAKIAWLVLAMIAIGLWVAIGATFNLMEIPH